VITWCRNHGRLFIGARSSARSGRRQRTDRSDRRALDDHQPRSRQPYRTAVRVRAEIAVRHSRVFGIGGRRELRPTVEIAGRSFSNWCSRYRAAPATWAATMYVSCESSRRAVRGREHRCAGPLADDEVDRQGGVRRERDGDDLAALRVIARRRETRRPPADDGRAGRVSARGVPLRPCTSLRWCTVGGFRVARAPCFSSLAKLSM